MARTQEISLNLGPQHPSTHGVYRSILTLDGETITQVENVIGYLHRGLEKTAESRTYAQFIPYTDRIDYLAPLIYEHGYVGAVEKLAGIEVPERAEYLRVIMAELSRIASHLIFAGTMAIDLASSTAWMYCYREREKILDLFEMVAGQRMTTNYLRFGGVAHDLPPGFEPACRRFLAEFPVKLEEIHQLLTNNEIFVARTRGIGLLPGEKAIAYGVTGPNLRASGVKYDVRRAEPYSIYPRLDFEVPVRQQGDSFDRYCIRFDEMMESRRIILQALDSLPAGPVMGKTPKVLKPPAGEIYHLVESSKGAVGFYLVSDGSTRPYRLHIRGPSFLTIGVFPEMAKGWMMQDVISILASIDPVLGEIDR
ncbi:MAG: NADH-quinone oxidoreductase subunit D [Syntrophomonadaceae bacterium]|nr:NADH-quinone oxidoreductase subunit D [Syntrophomonadaceae bacterium]